MVYRDLVTSLQRLPFHPLMPAESLVQLGEHLVLQFVVSSEVPRRRLLPRTPGQQLNEAPPSKPTRTQSSVSQYYCN